MLSSKKMSELIRVVGFDIPSIIALVESESITLGIPTLSILTRAAHKAVRKVKAKVSFLKRRSSLDRRVTHLSLLRSTTWPSEGRHREQRRSQRRCPS